MTNITLSKQQDEALMSIREWYRPSEGHVKHSFILNGSAGVGKTMLAQTFPEMITEEGPRSVIYAAFTGKAALQLRRKGCENAVTLHKLLYSPLEKNRADLLAILDQLRAELLQDPEGKGSLAESLKQQAQAEKKRIATPSWQLKPVDLPPEVKLIAVDESGMVDSKIYNDLLALGKKIVFIGDPFQLPPVFGLSPIMQQEPDFVLSEVHRQALESPVLRAAVGLRNGTYPQDDGSDERFQILSPKEATYEHYATADQVLCGRNKTRRELNRRMRKRLVEQGKIALSPLPIARGDKVVFLRNDYDEGVFNGSVANVSGVIEADEESSLIIDADGDELIHSYLVWAGVVEGQDISEAPRRCQVVDHAHALTVHKSQGSEWGYVVVHQEPIGYGTDALRWLYTALTRAQEKCVIVDKSQGS